MAELKRTVHCPACGGAIHGPLKDCPSCGYAFSEELQSLVSSYYFLLAERDAYGRINAEVVERMGDIAGRITAQERLLEKELSRSEAQYRRTEKERREKEARQAPVAPVQSASEAPPGEPMPAEGRSTFEIRMGQKWLLVAGIVTTVFGVGYFLKYSFDQGWIGPAGRVAMAYLLGLAALAGGDRFRKKGYGLFGLALIGGAVAVLYFATFAAFQIYDLFNAPVSFGFMVLTTALACALSLAYDNKWLAVLGLIGGFLTPLLLSTGADNQPVLMGYMALLNVGILAIAFRKQWPLLNILGFIATWLLFSGWYAAQYSPDKFWLTLAFLTLFYLIYSAAPLVYHMVRTAEDEIRGLVIVVPNSFFAFGFSFAMIKEMYSVEWVSVATLFYALVFAAMAWTLTRLGRAHIRAFVLLIAKSALFLIITVPILFSNHWITLFWAAQAIVLLWAAYRLESRPLEMSSLALMALALGKFLFHDYVFVFGLKMGAMAFVPEYVHLLPERAATTLFVIAVLACARLLAGKHASAIGRDAERIIGRILLILAATTLFIALNIETAALFFQYSTQARFAAITVLWTLFSAGVMLAGFRWNSAPARNAAIVLFGITLFKVFVIDIARFSTPFRILSFIILGIVLVAVSYCYYRFKDRIIEVLSQEKKENQP